MTSVHAAQPITEPEFASDIVDRYAIIFYGSGAGWRWLLSTVTSASSQLWRNATGNNVRPQLDSVIRIASPPS
ncbi:hypothetical protein DMI69_19150 [Escherichia coli]|nr:hypothetical protein [Escherichia coli]